MNEMHRSAVETTGCTQIECWMQGDSDRICTPVALELKVILGDPNQRAVSNLFARRNRGEFFQGSLPIQHGGTVGGYAM